MLRSVLFCAVALLSVAVLVSRAGAPGRPGGAPARTAPAGDGPPIGPPQGDTGRGLAEARALLRAQESQIVEIYRRLRAVEERAGLVVRED